MIDHLVIGGGISGLLTAYYLNQAGKRVCLLERGLVGRESSWAGGGIISPLYPWRYPQAVTQLVQWSQQEFPQLTEVLDAATRLDSELLQSGMLILDEPDEKAALQWGADTHSAISVIGAAQVASLEPALQEHPEHTLWMPDIYQVRNPRLVKALREYLLKNGVLIQENTEVTAILREHGQVTGVKTEQTEFKSAQVAVTCGAWSPGLWPSAEKPLPVKPIRGQMLMINSRPGLIKRIVLRDNHYVIPRNDGRILVGSTMEDVGFDKTTTQYAHDLLLKFAYDLMPILQDFKVERQWAGLRPGTPDNIPRIMQHTDIKGLFINAGHFRNGVVTAPASAKLLVNLMLNEQPILDPKPYS
ncbi:MAG: glycine oxidase ThiO [Gammaproteobacteria bacterium]|jgi:glycine oxidase|nr:glycine oxidase ThiO [Gammaproteobacteria bacterium]